MNYWYTVASMNSMLHFNLHWSHGILDSPLLVPEGIATCSVSSRKFSCWLFVDSPLEMLDLQSGSSKELLTGSWHLHNSWLGFFRAWLLETNTVRSEILALDAMDTNQYILCAYSAYDSWVFCCVWWTGAFFLGFYRSDYRSHGLENIGSFIFSFWLLPGHEC